MTIERTDDFIQVVLRLSLPERLDQHMRRLQVQTMQAFRRQRMQLGRWA
jgi:hypothetical protein